MKLTDKLKRNIHLYYGIILSVMLAVTGILFISSCYSIYKSGASPFTRQSISEAFADISAMVYVTVSLTVIGAGLDIILPREKVKLKGERSLKVAVKRLSALVDVDSLDTDVCAKITKERKLRRILNYVRICLYVASAVLPLIYLLNPSNFPAESGRYNAEILHGMLLYLAFLAPVTVYEIVLIFALESSLAREQELLRDAVKLQGKKEQGEKAEHKFAKIIRFFGENEKPIKLGVRIALIGCSVLFIVLGVLNGGVTDVLNKAIKICTECIGLG